jgi:phosphoribosylaminoimidazole (AIR) synthetase
MLATFNMGIGMVLVVPPSAEEAVVLGADGARVIGRVTGDGALAIH